MSEPHTFSATDIEVLDGLKAVRRRPGMYIGSTSGRGVMHMLWEVVSNSIDEHLAGHATKLNIRLDPDGSWEVTDNGRGIDPEHFKNLFEVIHCGPWAPPTPDGHLPHVHVHSGHGVGVVVVNALSSWLKVESRHKGVISSQMYRKGQRTGALGQWAGDPKDTGTTVSWMPDPEIFTEEHTPFPKTPDVAPRIRELAALTPGMKITMQGIDYTAPSGLRSLTGDGPTMTNQGRLNDIDFSIAVSWGREPSTNQLFMNYVDLAQTAEDKMDRMLAASKKEGRHTVVSMLMQDPRYAGPTHQRLGDEEAIKTLRKFVKTSLKGFLVDHPELAAGS